MTQDMDANTATPEERCETLGIEQLTPDPRNARRHNARNVGQIAHSLQTLGAARSIVIDETGRILAGNGVVEAAAQAGITRVRLVESDGSEIIAVVRPGLSEVDKLRLSVADNRASDLSDFDAEALGAIGAEIDLTEYFFPEELSGLLASPASLPEFKAYDESIEKDVEFITCPECGHKWPK